MSRHPIRLLVPAFISALMFGLCIALLLRALTTGAASFVVFSIVGALFYGTRTVTESRQVWPQFVVELEHRKAMRRAAPFTRINPSKEDVQ